MIATINLAEKFSKLHECWSPKIVGDVNEMHVKIVKIAGEFVWHHHDVEDHVGEDCRRAGSSSSSAAAC